MSQKRGTPYSGSFHNGNVCLSSSMFFLPDGTGGGHLGLLCCALLSCPCFCGSLVVLDLSSSSCVFVLFFTSSLESDTSDVPEESSFDEDDAPVEPLL